MALFQELWQAGLTIAFVTHDSDVAAYASRVLVIHDGRILSDDRQTPVLANPSPIPARAAAPAPPAAAA